MQLLLDFTQSNVIFEPSFAEIHEALREIWLLEHKFQARNWRYQICQQTVHKINKFHSHFQLKSKQEGRNNEF